MKIVKAHISEFRSIWDSNEFDIGDITCLVGKNESGKTALLQALYKLNPIIDSEEQFNVTNDYPRAEVSDYEEDVLDEKREPATVIRCTFELTDADIKEAQELFGKKVFTDNYLILSRRYQKDESDTSTRSFILSVNNKEGLTFFIKNANIPQDLQDTLLSSIGNVSQMVEEINSVEKTSEIDRLKQILTEINDNDLSWYIYNKLLRQHLPKFLYFDDFYQMKGYENIEALNKRLTDKQLIPSDYPLLGLLGLARIDLTQLINPSSTQELVNKIEGAGNRLSRKVLQYWSQNKHIQMRFDVRPARPEDPDGLTSGTNIWANIYDSRHMVSTNLGTRSKGFLWFFSFLAWYSRIERENKKGDVVLLLDEPGLFLHGRAQADLLEYFEDELIDKHQILYTTHSPFMVDSTKFNRVRIVQDKGIDQQEKLPKTEDGTKVLTEVLDAHEDSLFPLQGALGYEIYQTLFVGKNCLIVEGVSDLLYLQSISSVLERKEMEGLSSNWTITPVGGIDKVPTFVALLGSQKKLNIATLVDFQQKDAQSIENLYKKKLLNKKNVLTFCDFTDKPESDIEDMFDTDFFLKLVNNEYGNHLQQELTDSILDNKHPRILVRLEKYLEKNALKGNNRFSHYRPARYLVENLNEIESDFTNNTLNRFEKAFKTLNSLL